MAVKNLQTTLLPPPESPLLPGGRCCLKIQKLNKGREGFKLDSFEVGGYAR